MTILQSLNGIIRDAEMAIARINAGHEFDRQYWIYDLDRRIEAIDRCLIVEEDQFAAYNKASRLADEFFELTIRS